MHRYSLAQKLALGFAVIALASACLTSVLSNYLIAHHFDSFLSTQREERALALTRELEVLIYNNLITESWLQNVCSVAMADHVYMKVYGALDILLWEEGPCENHHHTIGAGKGAWTGPADEVSYSLKTPTGDLMGHVVFGYIPPVPSPAQIDYTNNIWLAGILAAGVAALFGAGIGWVVSQLMSKPLRDLAEAIDCYKVSRQTRPLEVPEERDEIGELTHAFSDLQTSLQQQETKRRHLTADVAHELRTPLAALRAQIEAIQDGVYEASPERLAGCHREILRLTSLVDDVENLANFEADNQFLDKRPSNLAAVVKDVSDGFAAAVSKAGLNLKVETISVIACFDPGRISQVVLNLLSNAAKYAPPGSTITVRIRATNDAAIIEVEDSGKGIPENDLPHIFDRFYRGEKSRSRKSGGAGLGLAIAKAIVEAHGGKITAVNIATGGARFIVKLPLNC